MNTLYRCKSRDSNDSSKVETNRLSRKGHGEISWQRDPDGGGIFSFGLASDFPFSYTRNAGGKVGFITGSSPVSEAGRRVRAAIRCPSYDRFELDGQIPAIEYDWSSTLNTLGARPFWAWQAFYERYLDTGR